MGVSELLQTAFIDMMGDDSTDESSDEEGHFKLSPRNRKRQQCPHCFQTFKSQSGFSYHVSQAVCIQRQKGQGLSKKERKRAPSAHDKEDENEEGLPPVDDDESDNAEPSRLPQSNKHSLLQSTSTSKKSKRKKIVVNLVDVSTKRVSHKGRNTKLPSRFLEGDNDVDVEDMARKRERKMVRASSLSPSLPP
jgi:hypothetical protein